MTDLYILDQFMKYASVNSQSDNDSTCTHGQVLMARMLKSDADSLIAASKVKGATCVLSPENYLYVTIPANVKGNVPSLGISCHLDITPEATGGNIKPIISLVNGHMVACTDGTTLLGADDKCGCAIAMGLIKTLLQDKKLRHGKVTFAFCPNEDVGRAAENIDSTMFSPDILFDLDGPGGEVVTKSNFTARGLNLKFIGHDAHPGSAKADKLGDATAAASTFISSVPLEYRPENTEGLQGYIHPWSFEKDGSDVTVSTRIRYFDKEEGVIFDTHVNNTIDKIKHDFPNVSIEILYDGIQYENVAYTLHPKAHEIVTNAAAKIGKKITFADERGGTTAAMFAAKGLKGGMCIFTGQHNIHSTQEYADFNEMLDSYKLMVEIVKQVALLK